MGLGFLSTSYAGWPGKITLSGNFLGTVWNIRVKNPNQFYIARKTRATTRQNHLARQRIDQPPYLPTPSESIIVLVPIISGEP